MKPLLFIFFIVASLAGLPAPLLAQATPTAKQVPPPGIEVPAADAAELQAGLDKLGKDIEELPAAAWAGPSSPDHGSIADAEVFHKAVRYALQYGEFFNPKEIPAAKTQLALGLERAAELRDGHHSWTSATGPLILGYTSRIDGSPQPYGLIVPEDWKPGDKTRRPIYLWFHGRSDTLSEINFIASRIKAKRDFATANAFELHLYGRFCNASKFAGEVDAFEALADVQRRYMIDPNRIAIMGFSMGGATAWHIGAHSAGQWAVVSPGAGFAETQVYAKVYSEKKVPPPWWEEVLYRLYNVTDVAANYSNVPLLAYSGEIDPQKQSADIMEAAMAREGLKMERFIGPNTEHKYEPETKKALSKRVDEIMAEGREPLPKRVHFRTYTLRYNQMDWITIDALEKHWEKAEIDAQTAGADTVQIKTTNIAALTVVGLQDVALPGRWGPSHVVIDGQEVEDAWRMSFWKTAGKWTSQDPNSNARPLVKRHGVQGPIDDAFMDSFIFVRPTGKALNEAVGAWTQSEMERAVRQWRAVFRGDARVKDDTAITALDIANSNLVLWGDPGSNSFLQGILTKIPIQWTKDQLTVGGQTASAADHAPILIYPNPLNTHRYVVLNSGFTFRMGSRTSNSLQTPKLPDWALIDLRTPPNEQWPGQVVDAGFFDERWQFLR